MTARKSAVVIFVQGWLDSLTAKNVRGQLTSKRALYCLGEKNLGGLNRFGIIIQCDGGIHNKSE